jgi:hypothetical protein
LEPCYSGSHNCCCNSLWFFATVNFPTTTQAKTPVEVPVSPSVAPLETRINPLESKPFGSLESTLSQLTQAQTQMTQPLTDMSSTVAQMGNILSTFASPSTKNDSNGSSPPPPNKIGGIGNSPIGPIFP